MPRSMIESIAVYSVSFSLLFLHVSALPNLWSVNIDEGPAPSPQDGPPLSASAVRNKAYLPLELGAIFGSYVLAIILISAGLLTLGRRLRRSAQTSPRTLAMEIMNPAAPANTKVNPPNPWDPSPVSPFEKKREWPSPAKSFSGQTWGSKNKAQHSMHSSVVTFNESVIEEDRTKNEIEMDRLYAAVAEHEEQKMRAALQPQSSPPPMSPLAQHPPELQHLRHGPLPPHQLSPPPVPEDVAPPRKDTSSPRRGGTRLSKPSPISVASTHSRASSSASFGSFSKKRSVRNLPISPPMGSPDMYSDNMGKYGESEPLTPRHYTPGPPPTPPHRQDSVDWEPQVPQYHRPSLKQEHSDSVASPRQESFGNLASPRQENFGSLASPRQENFGNLASPRQENFGNLASPRQENFGSLASPRQESFGNLASPRQENFGSLASPRPEQFEKLVSSGASRFSPAIRSSRTFFSPLSPRRTGSTTSSLASPPATQTTHELNDMPAITINAPPSKFNRKPASKPAPLALQTNSFSESVSSLPLRSAPLPLRNMNGGSDRPVSTIKATTIERKPNSHLLRAPGTGVPSTPYSPYMPFTPLTPMTPSRLVTREERKRMEKEAGRRVATVEDAVPEESEMWG